VQEWEDADSLHPDERPASVSSVAVALQSTKPNSCLPEGQSFHVDSQEIQNIMSAKGKIF
jgi:hypothetical protein